MGAKKKLIERIRDAIPSYTEEFLLTCPFDTLESILRTIEDAEKDKLLIVEEIFGLSEKDGTNQYGEINLDKARLKEEPLENLDEIKECLLDLKKCEDFRTGSAASIFIGGTRYNCKIVRPITDENDVESYRIKVYKIGSLRLTEEDLTNIETEFPN